MFQLSGSLKLLAVSLLASLMPIGAAQAEHFKFIVLFTDGPLSGSAYAGYFSTNKPSGGFFLGIPMAGQVSWCRWKSPSTAPSSRCRTT